MSAPPQGFHVDLREAIASQQWKPELDRMTSLDGLVTYHETDTERGILTVFGNTIAGLASFADAQSVLAFWGIVWQLAAAPPAPPPWMDADNVALVLGVHSNTIRRLCRQGKIKGAVRLGRQWRIPTESVLPHTNGGV